MKEKLKPVRDEFLIVGRPQVLSGDAEAVVEVAESGWWVSGPKTKEFTAEFQDYIGAKSAIPVSSGTAALHLSLEVLGVGSDDEVITTPFTYPATSHVIVWCGAKPVFVDIEPDTFNISSEKIEEAITPRTKAIIPVDIAGHPCRWDEIMEIARRHNLYVVDDAAHAIEASYKEKKIGRIADLTCFSFDVTKNVPGGVGGMITTDNEKWGERLRILSHFGLSQSSFSEPYETVDFGYKYDMTDFCAALALRNLERIEENLKIRDQYWQILQNELSETPQITLPVEKGNIRHARHLFMILLNLEKLSCGRKEFMETLAEIGVGSRIRFTPVHLHKVYQEKFGFKPGDCPIVEDIGKRVVCLPFSAALSEKDVRDIIKGVKMVVNYFKKD